MTQVSMASMVNRITTLRRMKMISSKLVKRIIMMTLERCRKGRELRVDVKLKLSGILVSEKESCKTFGRESSYLTEN